jgi:sortase A
LLVLGSLALGIYGSSIAYSYLYQAEAGRAIDRSIRERGEAGPSPRPSLTRFEAGPASSVPLARLKIPSVGLSAIVLEGSDEISLLRGVGHIEGTSRPGEAGNVGLAGHRDSFFRGLSRIGRRTEIDLTTPDGRDLRYTVESTDIVEPERVDVLAPTEFPTLTLVTCYPFNYFGSAPLRYVVRATLEGGDRNGVLTP